MSFKLFVPRNGLAEKASLRTFSSVRFPICQMVMCNLQKMRSVKRKFTLFNTNPQKRWNVICHVGIVFLLLYHFCIALLLQVSSRHWTPSVDSSTPDLESEIERSEGGAIPRDPGTRDGQISPPRTAVKTKNIKKQLANLKPWP